MSVLLVFRRVRQEDYSLSSRDIVSKTKQPTTENPQVQVLLSSRLHRPGCVGDAGRQWDHTADSKREGTAAFPAPPLQAVEARAGTQSDEHSGPQSPHPSAEREAVWPNRSHQRTLSEGAAGWRADTPAPVEGGGRGQSAFPGVLIQPAPLSQVQCGVSCGQRRAMALLMYSSGVRTLGDDEKSPNGWLGVDAWPHFPQSLEVNFGYD